MKIIIIQGMTCLGKSTLCKQLEKDLPNCKHFSLDEYKENMWDKFGFDSVEQREHQSKLARELFYSDINEAVKKALYDYILIDYAFTNKYWNELLENLANWNGLVRTIYLKPTDLQEHKKIWEIRSRDFSVRHAGHGATHYHDGIGTDYVNKYDTKVFEEMPTTNQTMKINISFNPYLRSVSYNSIIGFIKNTSMIRKSTADDKELIQQLIPLCFGDKNNLEPYEDLEDR